MKQINNDFYCDLDWTQEDHPIALLRAENKVRAPWVSQEIRSQIGSHAKVLDVGCGAGFLSNALAEDGFETVGIDLSNSSLEIARQTGKAHYIQANAYSLPFPKASFDAVCAMDILEHVEVPSLLVAEAARVLKPGGLFFFHTFNRNPLSYLVIIKGVEWFVPNTPPNMHVYPLFIRPHELEEHFELYKLNATVWRGFIPTVSSVLKMVLTRRIPEDFSFHFSRSLKTGYCGIAVKQVNY